MRKTTKNVMLGLLSLAFVTGVSAGAFAMDTAYSYAEETATATVENLATDAANWNTAFSFSEAGMTATTQGGATLKEKVAPNSTLTFETVGTATGTWGNAWIIIKDKRTNPNAASANDANGDYVALRLGAEFVFDAPNAANQMIVECTDGVVSYHNIGWLEGGNNNDVWNVRSSEITWTVTTTDTETGVSFVFGLVGSNGTNCTFTYESTNMDLQGEYSVSVGCLIDFGEGDFTWKNVTVEENVPDPNLATDTANWTNGAAFTAKEDGMYANSGNVYGITKAKFGASDTLNYETVGTFGAPGESGFWCFGWLVIKQSDPTAKFDPSACTMSGNAVVLRWGASAGDVRLIEFVDGVQVSNTVLSVSGYDHWHTYAVTTSIQIRTYDTATGYNLDLTFASTATNTPATYSYESNEVDLKGDGYAQFGYFGSGTVTETTNYVLTDFTVEEYVRNIATEAASWNSPFAFSEAGMTATTQGGATLKEKVPANATITFETEGDATGGWGNAWIIIKDKRENPDASSANAASGDYVALRLGAEFVFDAPNAANQMIVECTDGVVSYHNIGWLEGGNNTDVWNVRNSKVTWTVTTTDTATGVLFEFGLVGSNGTNCTFTYESLNPELKGDYSIGVGCLIDFGTGSFTWKNVSVVNNGAPEGGETPETPAEPEELAPELENLATSASNFKGGLNASGFVINKNGAVAKGTPAMSISLAKDVKANSTIAVDLQGNANSTWGEGWIIFKDVSATQVIDARQENATFANLTPDMNYLAFRWGNSHLAAISEVVDGVLTETHIPTTEWPQDAYTYFYNEDRIRILITTTDTETGVDVEITFVNLTKDYTLTYNYSSTNTKLHGDYAMNVGHYTGMAATEYITYKKIGVTETVAKIDRSGLLNMATSLDYVKDGLAVKAFSWVDGEGLILEGVNTAGMLMYQPVVSGQTVTMQWNNTLVDATFGNCYMVIKNLSGKYINIPNPNEMELGQYNATTDANDNWLAVMFGADGLKFYVCVNGQVEVLSLGEGADNTDVWYWYKQATVATITATDVAATDDDDAHVRVDFTLVGPSGKTTVKSYLVYDEVFFGQDGLFQYEYYLSMGGNLEMNYDYICLERLVYSGVEEINLPEIDMDSVNATIAQYATITAENYEAAKAFYAETAVLTAQFNYSMNATFNAEGFASVAYAISAYETAVEDAAVIVAKINALATEVNADNYDAVKAAVASIKQDYAMLSDAGKAMVSNYATVATVEEAIAAYEASILPETPGTSEEPTTSEEPATSEEPTTSEEPATSSEAPASSSAFGCMSSVGVASALATLVACGAVFVCKKKED